MQALFRRTVIASPVRLMSASDVKVQRSSPHRTQVEEIMHKGDSMWVLDHLDEGYFNAWWHCHEVGLDSTLPHAVSDEDSDRLYKSLDTRASWIRIQTPGDRKAWIEINYKNGEPNQSRTPHEEVSWLKPALFSLET